MVRVAFFGSPVFALPTLQMLVEEGYDIAAVYTQPDRPMGRGRRQAQSPVKEAALAYGLRVLQPASLRAPGAAQELQRLGVTVAVVAAYGLLLPDGFLNAPPFGCLNVHPSLLPRHRGAAPVAAALLAGDVETGSTIFRMERGMDTGPILAQRPLAVAPEETAGELTERLAHQGAGLLRETLPRWLRGEIVPVPQDDSQATYSRRIKKEDGVLDWSRPAGELARCVRAFNPWPSAFTWWGERMVKVLDASARPGVVGEPGHVVTLEGSGEVAVATGEGLLVLRRVQLQGKRAMPAEAFLRGQPAFLGARLGHDSDGERGA